MSMIWDPTAAEWRFSVMNGSPYGVGSVVLTFNRFPTLATAAARRIFCIPAGAYFDDIATLDVVAGRGSGRQTMHHFLTTLGAPPKKAKSYSLAAVRPYLGVCINLSHILEDGLVDIIPKEITRRQTAGALEQSASTRCLPLALAGKYRGKSGWIASNTFGRLGRMGQSALKAQQYGQTPNMDEQRANEMKFHAEILRHVPPQRSPCGATPDNH